MVFQLSELDAGRKLRRGRRLDWTSDGLVVARRVGLGIGFGSWDLGREGWYRALGRGEIEIGLVGGCLMRIGR
jgi:hypothetical protein